MELIDQDDIPLDSLFIKLENEDISEFDVDPSKFCQGCMRNSNNLRDMMHPYSHHGRTEIYSEMIDYCFSMQMGRNREERLQNVYFICGVCVQKLRDAVAFRKQVEVSQKTIRQRRVTKKAPSTSYLDLSTFQDSNFDSSDGGNHSDGEGDEFIRLLTNKKVIKPKMSIKKEIKREIKKESKKEVKKLPIKKEILNATSQIKDGKRFFTKMPVHRSNSLKVVLRTPKTQNNSESSQEKIVQNTDDVGLIQDDTKIKPPEKKPFVKSTYNYNKLPYTLDSSQMQCHLCNEVFESHIGLRIHMPSHFPNFTCEHCGRGFANIVQFKRHSNVHSTERYECPKCPGKIFKTMDSRWSHMKRKHSDNPNVHRCPHCSERFASYDHRRKHLVNVHGKTEEACKYKCKMCDKYFTSSGRRSIHIRKSHLNERNNTCKTCGKAYYSKAYLRQHMLSHTGVKDFACSVCNKGFQRKYTLTEHMKIHTGDKKHICNVCGKAFTQKCSLKGHMIVHEREGLKGES